MRLLALYGLLLLSGLGSSSGGKRDETRACPPPNRLDPPAKPELPAFFIPVLGSQRVVETSCRLPEGSGSYPAKRYLPALSPSPWEVWAWYEPHRSAHVIEVRIHPSLENSDAVKAKVFVGEGHTANRCAFKANKQSLWPDDKYKNRVVFRAPRETKGLCFLIDITACDLHLDFFHEPLIDVAAFVPGPPDFDKDFAQLTQIEELEKRYAAERKKLEDRADLSSAVKRQLEARLMLIRERAVKKIIDGDD